VNYTGSDAKHSNAGWKPEVRVTSFIMRDVLFRLLMCSTYRTSLFYVLFLLPMNLTVTGFVNCSMARWKDMLPS
jgi:hypothetical protein